MVAALKSVETAESTPVQAKLLQLREELNQRFYEREREIAGLLAAIVGKQNILLLGSPGTGKSALTRATFSAFTGTSHFELLMRRDTTAEEVFGIVPPKKLIESEDYVRNTTGKLPEAYTAFLDEIWKSNSTVLNGLLTIINERIFHNGNVTMKCPLMTVVGASNELPEEGEGLSALDDRFTLRFWVEEIENPANQVKLLRDKRDSKQNGGYPKLQNTITLQELQQMQTEANTLPVSDEVLNALVELRQKLKRDSNIIISSRTHNACLDVLTAYAYVEGDQEVTTDHFEIFKDSLWKKPTERTEIIKAVAAIGNPFVTKSNQLLQIAEEMIAQLGPCPSEESQKPNWFSNAAGTKSRLEEIMREIGELASRMKKTNRRISQSNIRVKQILKQLQNDMAQALNLN